MVQVLETPLSPLQALTPQINQTVGNLVQGFKQRGINKSDQAIINQFESNPNMSPMEMLANYGRLSPEKQQAYTPVIQQFLKTNAIQESKERESQSAHEDISQSVNSLIDKLESGEVGKFNQWNQLFAKGRENRAYFDVLAVGIESRLAQMLGKGTLNQKRFDYLMGLLPKASNTDATNRGKLKAFVEEFKVNAKNPEYRSSNDAQQEQSDGKYLVSPTGKRVFIPKDQVEAALKAGGKLE